MKQFSFVLAAVLLSTVSAWAQSSDTILLPIVPGAIVVGAFGSKWITDAVATNISDTPLQLSGFFPCNIDPCLVGPMPPHSSVHLSGVVGCSEVPGAYLIIPMGRERDLSLTLRSQDLSRQGETWGTSVPVVADNAAFETRFGLTDIPVNSQFRSMLRIYALDGNTQPRVRLRVYSEGLSVLPGGAGDVVLYDSEPDFVIPHTGGGTDRCPATAQIFLSTLPQVAGESRIRVEIEPLTVGKYWGFASITHNETQHVTVVTPQPQ